MNNRRKIGIASVMVVAAAATLGVILLSNTDKKSAINGTVIDLMNNVTGMNQSGGTDGEKLKTVINISSSPSASPLVEKWIAQYNNEGNQGVAKVNYSDDLDDATRASTYRNASDFLSRNSADLAITGNPFIGQNSTNSKVLFLPVSPQAIVIIYNVPGFPDIASGLRLNATTLYLILAGNITSWDDEKIRALNPGTSLPNERIIVVHEAGTGSASALLESYLHSASNDTVNWPQGSIASESANDLAATVRQTPFSLGYIDFSYAIQTKMTYGALENSDGEYVLPSPDSVDRAIQNGTMLFKSNDTGTERTALSNQSSFLPPETSVGRLGNGSYPIVGFYYAVFESTEHNINAGTNDTSDSDQEAELKVGAKIDLVKWIVGLQGLGLLIGQVRINIAEVMKASSDLIICDLDKSISQST